MNKLQVEIDEAFERKIADFISKQATPPAAPARTSP